MPQNRIIIDIKPKMNLVSPSRKAASQTTTTTYNSSTTTWSSATQVYGGGDTISGEYPKNNRIINL